MYQSDVYQLNRLLKQMRQECQELQEEMTESITLVQDVERINKGQKNILKQLNGEIAEVGNRQRGYWEPYKQEKMERRLQRYATILPA